VGRSLVFSAHQAEKLHLQLWEDIRNHLRLSGGNSLEDGLVLEDGRGTSGEVTREIEGMCWRVRGRRQAISSLHSRCCAA